jgi:cell division protein FtsZ
VLINILGGADLTLGEATQISEIIHDAVGDDAQIIFGAGGDPNLTGEVRVTVIATGFDRAVTGEPVVDRGASGQVLPFRKGPAGAGGGGMGGAPPIQATPAPAGNSGATGQTGQASQQPYTRPAAPAQARPAASPDVSDMEIPTFIRRQMD